MTAIASLSSRFTAYANAHALDKLGRSANVIADARAASAKAAQAAAEAAAKNEAGFSRLRAAGVDVEVYSFADIYKTQLLTAVDTNGDGKPSQAELGALVTAGGGTAQQAEALYRALDADGDGTVSGAEFKDGIPNPFATEDFSRYLQASLQAAARAAQTGAPDTSANAGQQLDAAAILAGLAKLV